MLNECDMHDHYIPIDGKQHINVHALPFHIHMRNLHMATASADLWYTLMFDDGTARVSLRTRARAFSRPSIVYLFPSAGAHRRGGAVSKGTDAFRTHKHTERNTHANVHRIVIVSKCSPMRGAALRNKS